MNDSSISSIKRGNYYTYDCRHRDEECGGDGKTFTQPGTDWSVIAARGILADLTDRRGVKHELEAVDEDVRESMITDLAAIIAKTFENRELLATVDFSNQDYLFQDNL